MALRTTIWRRCAGTVLLIVLAVSACKSQVPSVEGAGHKSQPCTPDAPAIAPESIEITEITNGVWQGFVELSTRCGTLTGRLYYANERKLLRFEITPDSRIDRAPPARIRNEILRASLRKLFALYGQQSSYAFATNAYPEIGERLTASSAESPQWDKQTGQPYGQTTAAYAKVLINREQGYPELAKTFVEWNYTVRVSGVEKVLVRPVREMTAAERSLVKAPLRDEDRLPVSAAIFYTIEKK